MGLPATFHPKSATADHRHASSSTLEIPEGFLRICVLAWRRRRPVFRVRRHEKTHGRKIASSRVEIDELIRTRRTQKAYEPGPVESATLDELFELARWAPNHHLTNPWRFRVLGPRALDALKAAAEGGRDGVIARKLDRAPTLVAATAVQTGDQIADDEDFAAAACASFIVLLGAHARGLDGYWRTPEVLRTPAGRAACGIENGEKVVGLLHLGRGKGARPAPERAPLDDFRTYLP